MQQVLLRISVISSTPLYGIIQKLKQKLFYPSWFKGGIISPADIVDNNGTVLSKQVLENSNKFGINFLDYHRIKVLLVRNINKLKYIPFERPFIPAQMEPLIKSNKGSRNFYLSQLKNNNTQEDFQIN